MKKISVLLSALLVGGVFAFVSCSKTGTTGPAGTTGATGAAGPVLTGTIAGTVFLSNQYGVSVTTGLSAANIVLKNSATGVTVDSVYANATGQYSIPNVPTGAYTMLCNVPGYGLNKHQNIVFPGGGTDSIDNKLAAIPTFTISTASDSIRHKNNTNYLYGTIAADAGGARSLLVFIGNTPSVSANPGSYSLTANTVIPADSTTFTITTAVDNFYAAGFAYGSTVYMAIYGAADNYTYGDYTNYTYDQTVYTAISANPYTTVSILLP